MFPGPTDPLIEETLQRAGAGSQLYSRRNQKLLQRDPNHLKYDGYFKGIYGADLENKRGESGRYRHALTEIEKEQKRSKPS